MQRAAINQLSNDIALPNRSCIVQCRRKSWNIVAWCPGRESYATTDTTNRCLSLVWWRECLARWRRFATSRNHRGSPVLPLAGSLVRGEESLWPAGSRRLVEPLAGFKSWIGFEPITFRLLADERPLCDRSGPSIGSTESKRTDTLSNDARSLVAGMSFCLSLPLAALRSPDEVEHDRVLTALPRAEDGHDFRHDLTIPP